MKKLKLTHYTSLSVLAALIATGCNDNGLTPLVPNEVLKLAYTTVDAQFCTSAPQPAKQKVKYIFVLDHSQSNQPGFPLVAGDVSSTDPTGSRRYGPLTQFLNGLTPDPNNLTYFALIDFADNAYQPSNPATFFSSPTSFATVVDQDWEGCYAATGGSQTCLGTPSAPQPLDQGFTDYLGALTAVKNLIQTDVQAESFTPSTPPVKINYQVIFVSDGSPVDTNGNPEATLSITTAVTSILNIQSNVTFGPFISNISLNTVYYWNTTRLPNAANLLGSMATTYGNGQYNEYAASAGISYQQFAPPVRNVKYNLADAWVENENAVWWDNGQLMLDTDGDGLPDQIEVQMGSNPFATDSDGNGVSDLVEYRTKGVPCTDAHCAAANRDPYAVCDGFTPSVASDGTVTFPSYSNDGLNQCEKFILGAVQTDFDSNGDFIPDLMSLKNSIPLIAGTTGAFLNPFNDPLNNYGKLKAGLPTSISQSKVLNFTQRTMTLEHVTSTTPDNQCYHMVVDKVAVLNSGNTIKFSVIQNGALIENTPILQTAVRTLDGNNSPIYFVPSDFN